MPYFDFPTPDHLVAGVAILLATLGYMLFWWIVKEKAVERFWCKWFNDYKTHEYRIYSQRAAGFIGYGLVPAIVLLNMEGTSWAGFGVIARWTMRDSALAIVLGSTAFLIAFINAPLAKTLARYPEVRIPEWERGTLLRSTFWWVLYFAAYELMFRGFLLFGCAKVFGTGTAMIISVCLYALAHVAKTMREAVGSFIMGPILSVVTFFTGTIWVAIVVHLVLALSNEWLSLRLHPEIQLRLSRQ